MKAEREIAIDNIKKVDEQGDVLNDIQLNVKQTGNN